MGFKELTIDRMPYQVFSSVGLDPNVIPFMAQTYMECNTTEFRYHAAYNKDNNYSPNPLTSAQTIIISSTSANDNIATTTGAKVVVIKGVDSSFNLIQDTIYLNGTTPVNSNLQFLRISELLVGMAGSSGTNIGDIYAGIGSVVDGINDNPICAIMAGDSKSHNSFRVCPINQRVIIHDLSIHAAISAYVKIMLRRNGVSYLMNMIELKGTTVIPLYIPYSLVPMDEVWMMVAAKNEGEYGIISFRGSGYHFINL